VQKTERLSGGLAIHLGAVPQGDEYALIADDLVDEPPITCPKLVQTLELLASQWLVEEATRLDAIQSIELLADLLLYALVECLELDQELVEISNFHRFSEVS
jgi:hypothetical protein